VLLSSIMPYPKYEMVTQIWKDLHYIGHWISTCCEAGSVVCLTKANPVETHVAYSNLHCMKVFSVLLLSL
jgi:hypothetical protein